MLIGKNHKIESDTLNVILYKRHITKKGGEDWDPIGYYATPQNALKDMLNREISGTGMKDFQTVVNKIAELHKLIDGLKATMPTRKPTRPLEPPKVAV